MQCPTGTVRPTSPALPCPLPLLPAEDPRMRLVRKSVASLIVLSAMAVPALAGEYDWPQWLGPNRDGLSRETGLLEEWPQGGPPIAWQVSTVGLGYAGVSVADGKVFLLGTRDGVTHLFALDEQTGSELWATPIADAYPNGWGDGPRSTPTVDGDRVYAMAASGTLVCCKVDGGQEMWRVTMQDLGGKVPQWGFAESPLVDGAFLLCTPGGDKGAIAALDKTTGQVQWQSAEVTEGAQYASIIKAAPAGRPQYLQLLQKTVFAVDPVDGRKLWHQDWPGRVAVIPTLLHKDGSVYVTSGYGVGCRLVELGETGVDPTTVYDNKVMKSKHDGLVLLDDYLYGYSDGAGWTCQEFATGDRVWSEKGELEKGSVGYADGKLYCLAEKSGEVVLIEATPEGWREHGRFTLSPQTEQRNPKGGIWCHPVIANGKLYLRDQELLFAFDVKAE